MNEVMLEIDQGVAKIVLNAPERRNALTAEMVEDLISACDAVDDDLTVGAVILAAVGDAFCAGAHRAILDAAAADPLAPDSYRSLSLAYKSFVRVGDLLSPTVAAVKGHAVGAGVNLMLASDICIVSRTARIMSGFLRIGLHPGGGHFQLLGRLGGRQTAGAMGLFGAEIDGQRAAEVGLAWKAVPEEEVEAEAMQLAKQVANDPELARAAARSLRLELGPPPLSPAAALEVERGVQLWSLHRTSRH